MKFNRRNIFARDGNRCQYCGKRFPTGELSLDHVMPRSRGAGPTGRISSAPASNATSAKEGRTPAEAGMKLTKAPVKPRTSPTLGLKLANRKYQSWKTFLDDAYWTVELR